MGGVQIQLMGALDTAHWKDTFSARILPRVEARYAVWLLKSERHPRG